MTHLDADYEMFRSIQDAIPAGLRLSGPEDPPHWACASCGEPCYCVDPLSRRAPHRDCDAMEVIAA